MFHRCVFILSTSFLLVAASQNAWAQTATEEATKPAVVSKSDTTQDIQKILDVSLLKTEYSDRIFEIFALNAIQESGKTIELSTLLKKFKEQLGSPETLKAFVSVYEKVFTPQEIKELKQMLESKTFQKYTKSAVEINQADQQIITEVLASIINKEGKEKTSKSEFKPVEITKDNFQKEVEESSKPVIVDFYADWCVPCQLIVIFLQELNNIHGEHIKFVKVNYDKNGEIAKKYDVTSLPTLLFVKDGKVVDKQVGLGTNAELEAKVKTILDMKKTNATAKN